MVFVRLFLKDRGEEVFGVLCCFKYLVLCRPARVINLLFAVPREFVLLDCWFSNGMLEQLPAESRKVWFTGFFPSGEGGGGRPLGCLCYAPCTRAEVNLALLFVVPATEVASLFPRITRWLELSLV